MLLLGQKIVSLLSRETERGRIQILSQNALMMDDESSKSTRARPWHVPWWGSTPPKLATTKRRRLTRRENLATKSDLVFARFIYNGRNPPHDSLLRNAHACPVEELMSLTSTEHLSHNVVTRENSHQSGHDSFRWYSVLTPWRNTSSQSSSLPYGQMWGYWLCPCCTVPLACTIQPT